MEEIVSPVQNTHRPRLLSALCMLTFIWSGLMTLVSLIGIFVSGWLVTMLAEYVPQLYGIGTSVFIVIFLMLFVFWGLSLLGALKMYNLNKAGFVLYAISNGVMAIIQIFSIIAAFSPFGLLYLIVSILFITLYAINLKYMK